MQSLLANATSARAVAATAMALISTAHAIVIRSDRTEADSLRLAARFPSAVLVGERASGVLIAPQWVLTAAHVAEAASQSSLSVLFRGTRYVVDGAFRPNQWSNGGAIHDVGLLHLSKPIVGASCAKVAHDVPRPSENVVIVGGGAFGTGARGFSRTPGARMMRAATNQIDHVEGGQMAMIRFRRPPSATKMEGIGAPGDSGGPMYVMRHREWVVAAVGHGGVGGTSGRLSGSYGEGSSYCATAPEAAWIAATLAGRTARVRPLKGTETPEGRALALDFIRAFNSGSKKMSAFVSSHCEPGVESEQMNRSYPMFKSDLGELIAGPAFQRGKTLQVFAKSSRRKTWIAFALELDERHLIKGLRAMPSDPPK